VANSTRTGDDVARLGTITFAARVTSKNVFVLIARGALSRGACYVSRRRNQSGRVGAKNP
jgi:hypothetical protein